MPLPEIGKESKLFIEWSHKKLIGAEEMEKLIRFAMLNCKGFLTSDKGYLKDRLMKKLEKGASEHGEPVYLPYQLKKEFEDECIDLLGWTLVSLWQEERKKLR